VAKEINGRVPDHRRRERQKRSKPIAAALAAWADEIRRNLSRKSELAAAFRYMRARWTALMRCFDDGRLALDNNPAERALRCIAIDRKSTRLNSSHVSISYAVFCLKKKKTT